MKTVVICVLVALIVHKGESRTATDDGDGDFRPTPIPLKDWRPEKQNTAGTLHEIIRTETPQTIAAVPAHYWEDALRHSVYLTLVRDKIDQLIAKGGAISPDDKPNGLSRDVDDHDLWEKIKSAPFDRLRDDASPFGDLSILANGRLVEENAGFRFAEDDASHNCVNNCTKAVKAFWSVKRVRQRDAEPSGRYHYELTFSVTSQTPQKLKMPLENPIRTFTVKESAPIDPPVYQPYDSFHRHPSRPQRAIWVHKNIAPVHNHRLRQSTSDLDRIFGSLFSDEDSYEDQSQRYKPNNYVPQMYPQYSKVGYVGHRDTYHQKKMLPFPAQSPFKYSQPSLFHSSPPFIQNSYYKMDQYVNADNTFVKTTRAPVLPTPVAPFSFIRESTAEAPIKTLFNKTDYTTKPSEAISSYKMYKPKQPVMKISYTPEQVRPPVYNAPPGVFVTMDKKPFKPMPPLKQTYTKPVKYLPLDFRPSPQILETQFSDPDSSPGNAFRPITIHSDEDVYNKQVIIDSKKGNSNRKPSPSKKPPQKQDRKPQRTTTVVPEIITAQDDDDIDMEWTTLLGAFSKTTPMASQKEKTTTTESTTVVATATVPVTTAQADIDEDKIEYTSTPIPTTTTPMPKKRTRPPPTFKQEKKVKKHKRVTTTTSTTTTEPPSKFTVPNPTEDLTPQASSAPTSGANSVWEARNRTEPIKLTTSITKETLTTTRPTTTLTTSSTTLSTTVETKPPVVTTPSRSKNRFRQSTLMQKGTSVNHDKWFLPTLEKNRTTNISDKLYMRRKSSKFHGYNSSTTPRILDEDKNREDHEDHIAKSTSEMKSTESFKDDTTTNTITPSTQSNDEYGENNETATDLTPKPDKKEESNEEDSENNENDTRESKDDDEFIFQIKSTTPENERTTSTDTTSTTVPTTVASHLAAKNKTKCKKKKHNNLSTTEEIPKTTTEVLETIATTEKGTTPDILEELFGGFTMDGNENDEPQPSPSTTDSDSAGSQSIKHERYIGDDSVERFLESLEVKGNHQMDSDEQTDKSYDETSDISIEDSSFYKDDDEDSDSGEARYEDYYEENEGQGTQPYSILEFMTME